jgi:predicted CXXCH cytochrome family protein
LRGDCIGCHAQAPAGGSNIINSIPQVQHSAGTDLAGGNFQDGTTSQANIHNVDGLAGINQDTVLLNNPPGYSVAYDPASTGFDTNSQLVCAGQNGCHGNRDVVNEWTAVTGGHHGDDSMLKFGSLNEGAMGGSTAASYRFLWNVHGGENTSWLNESATSHNEYKGQTIAARAGQNWASIDTISELCAECHGVFHASATITNYVTSGPWLRHPTDYVLPNSGEYASISSTYHIDAPVGRANLAMAAPVSTVDITADIVTCLSCHAAHGTPYPDILRWDYTNTLAADTGCLYCHTGKLAY